MITNVRSYSETRVIQNRCNGEEEGGSREESRLQERVTCVTRAVTLLQPIICLTNSHLGVPDPIGYDNYDCIARPLILLIIYTEPRHSNIPNPHRAGQMPELTSQSLR
jgi:hypothetical protein